VSQKNKTPHFCSYLKSGLRQTENRHWLRTA